VTILLLIRRCDAFNDGAGEQLAHDYTTFHAPR
jgi:hypothetical protein